MNHLPGLRALGSTADLVVGFGGFSICIFSFAVLGVTLGSFDNSFFIIVVVAREISQV